MNNNSGSKVVSTQTTVVDIKGRATEIVTAALRVVMKDDELQVTSENLLGRNVGMESLDILDLSFQLTKLYGINVPKRPDVRKEWNTVQDVISFVETRLV